MNPRTSPQTRWPEFLFYALAIAGLAGTNAQVPAYVQGDFVAGNLAFWKDTVATPAATFILVDLFVLAAAVLAWMFGEARRIGLARGWTWLYFAGSLLIGISCFFPLFLAHRLRVLRRAGQAEAAPAGADLLGIGLTLATVLLAVAFSLSHIPAG